MKAAARAAYAPTRNRAKPSSAGGTPVVEVGTDVYGPDLKYTERKGQGSGVCVFRSAQACAALI